MTRGIQARQLDDNDILPDPWRPPREAWEADQAVPETALSEAQAGRQLLQQSLGNRALGSLLRRSSLAGRLAAAEKRARLFLDRHHAAARDALRAFVIAATARTGASRDRLTDAAGMARALGGVAAEFIAIALPRVGPQIGRALTVGIQAAGDAFAGQDAPSVDGTRRVMRRFQDVGELGLQLGFRQAESALAPLLAALSAADPDVGTALEIGGQDQVDAVIQVGLGIPNPDHASPYDALRRALEEEFARWLTPESALDEATTEAAAADAAGDAGEATKRRPGDSKAQMPNKTGKAE